MQMDGQEVFRRAVRVMVDSAVRTLAAAGVTVDDVALRRPPPGQRPHRRRRLPAARAPDPARRHRRSTTTGNTSAASIPLALVDAVDAGRLATGDLVLLIGFGAGMTWASALVRWSQPSGDGRTMSRVVLVTGGNRGIGLATRPPLRRRRRPGRRHLPQRTTADADADGLLGVPCDVTDTEQVDAAFTAVEEALGPVEVLVANAGITRDGLVLRMSDDDFTSVLDANLTGGVPARRAGRARR